MIAITLQAHARPHTPKGDGWWVDRIKIQKKHKCQDGYGLARTDHTRKKIQKKHKCQDGYGLARTDHTQKKIEKKTQVPGCIWTVARARPRTQKGMVGGSKEKSKKKHTSARMDMNGHACQLIQRTHSSSSCGEGNKFKQKGT